MNVAVSAVNSLEMLECYIMTPPSDD